MRAWQIGEHRVRHGDVADADLAQFLGGTKADVFYTDPPWGSGTLKYFNTLNKKQNKGTVEAQILEVDTFCDLLLDLAVAHTDGWVLIEYGVKWVEKIKQMAERKGLHYCGQVTGMYNNKTLPFELLAYRTDAPRPIDLSALAGEGGYTFVKRAFEAMKPEEGGIGMDLCCGMGYTARACIDNGMTFIGNELSEHRLQKTIHRLKKAEEKAA